MVFSAIHPGVLHDSSYTYCNQQGPTKEDAASAVVSALEAKKPEAKTPWFHDLLGWKKPMRIACLDAYLPCFGWSLGLVLGGLT